MGQICSFRTQGESHGIPYSNIDFFWGGGGGGGEGWYD